MDAERWKRVDDLLQAVLELHLIKMWLEAPLFE
jgi:hypothetical protein